MLVPLSRLTQQALGSGVKAAHVGVHGHVVHFDGRLQVGHRAHQVVPQEVGAAAGERFGRPVLKRIWEGNLRRLKAQVETGTGCVT